MTDQEIVDGLINRDEKITDWFFNIKYRPLFIGLNYPIHKVYTVGVNLAF